MWSSLWLSGNTGVLLNLRCSAKSAWFFVTHRANVVRIASLSTWTLAWTNRFKVSKMAKAVSAHASCMSWVKFASSDGRNVASRSGTFAVLAGGSISVLKNREYETLFWAQQFIEHSFCVKNWEF